MRAKIINEGGAFRSRRHYLLGTTLARAEEDKFEEVVYDIWPDITGDIFSKSVVSIANRVEDEDIDGYLERLNEWGGAGFSMGSSIFPVNRGGQMNRGGFGGANNLGGSNMMYTYEIKPLTRILQPKPNNWTDVEEIRAGNLIQGQELNKRDGEKHSGVLLRVEKTEGDDIKYYVILNSVTSTIMKIDPTTAILLSGNVEVQVPELQPTGGDNGDLGRAGQNFESKKIEYMRAKCVNEENNNPRFFHPIETTVDEFMTWYAGTPEWAKDWQTANVMEVNGVHAQDDGEDGMIHLANLADFKNNPIKVIQNRFKPGDWDLSFEVGNDEYSIQSATKTFAEEDDF